MSAVYLSIITVHYSLALSTRRQSHARRMTTGQQERQADRQTDKEDATVHPPIDLWEWGEPKPRKNETKPRKNEIILSITYVKWRFPLFDL